MKILFVLSQTELTGAETYALTLASALRKSGHEIVLVSEKLSGTHPFKFYSLPLHSRNSSTIGRIQNIRALKKIMQEERIELIHSHSRAANLVSVFALWNFKQDPASPKIPLVVTVHGRWRNHFAARWLPCLGSCTIAVCPYLERYLAEDLEIPKEQIHMVPNGIDSQWFAPSSNPKKTGSDLVFVGRFSGQKGKALYFFLRSIFPEIVKRIPTISLTLAGLSAPQQLKETAQQFNRTLRREAIKIVEFAADLRNLYETAAAVIGAGRVALEGMSCGKPVIAIGESSAPGLLTPENFRSAFDSNFGDCGDWNLFEKQKNLVADLERILANPSLAHSLSVWGRNTILEQFDAEKIAAQIAQLYERLRR